MADRIRIDVIAATEEAVKGIKNISVQVQSLDKDASKASQGVKKTNDALKDTEKQSKKSETGLKDIVKVFGSIGIAAAGLTGVIATLKKAFEFTREGAAVNQTKIAFDSLSGSIGGNADMLNTWREASNGTISDLNLMSGYQTVAAGTSKELSKAFYDNNARLLEISKAASALNPQLGDTAFMYESITRGIKRGSPLILDNLGLVIKTGEANEEYAAQLGKTVDQLTAEEKTMALLNAAIESGDRLINQLGGSVDSATDPWDRFTTAVENNNNAIKSASANTGIFQKILNGVSDNLNKSTRLTELKTLALSRGIISQEEMNKIMLVAEYKANGQQDAIDLLTNTIEDYDKEVQVANLDVGYLIDKWAMAGMSAEEIEKRLRLLQGATEDLSETTISLGDYFGDIVSMAKEYDDSLEEIAEKQDRVNKLLEIVDTGGYLDGVYINSKKATEEIAKLEGEIGVLKQSMTDMANQAILDMYQATLAIDGFSTAEIQNYFDMATELGLMSEEASQMAIDTYLNAKETIEAEAILLEIDDSTLDAVLAKFGAIPRTIRSQVITEYLTVMNRTPGGGIRVGTGAEEQNQALGGVYQTSTPTLFQSSEMNQPETAVFVPQGRTLWDVAPAEQVNSLLGGRGGGNGGNVTGGATYNINLYGASVEDAVRSLDQIRVMTRA